MAASTWACTTTRLAVPVIRPAVSLSARLKGICKLPQGRLKTGTPPRLDGRSIDYNELEAQPGDGMPGGLNPQLPVSAISGSGRHAPAPGAVLDHAYQCAHARHHPQWF